METATDPERGRATGLRPSRPLKARVRENAPKWVAVLVALNVAVGMAYSVAVLRRDGDKHRDISAAIVRIEERLDLQLSLFVANRLASSDALADGLRSLSVAILEDLDRLNGLGSSLEKDAEVNRGVTRHLHLVATESELREAGDAADVAASLKSLSALLSSARTAHGKKAHDAFRTADVESILMMVLAALMAVLLHKKFTSARRSADERAARERTKSEARFRSLVQNANDVILICDLETTIKYQTPSTETVLGFGDGELVGALLTESAHPNDARRLFAFCQEIGAQPGGTRTIEWRMKHRDGFWMHVESSANNLTDDPNVDGLVLTLRDISAQKSLEQQLKHQAFHDSLTNLANRALFSDRVGHALMRGDRSDSETAVLFVDIDDFKTVNDSLGHAAGDDLLIEFAGRLQRAVRPSDTVARLGGDEFAILLEDVSDTTDPQTIADRVLRDLAKPVYLRDRELFVRASIGIATSSRAEEGAEELLRNADVAMYMAKGAGKGTYAVFQPNMHVAVLDRLELKAALERGVEKEEFQLHYQPIVDLGTGEVCGVEALVRWQRDDALIPPSEFIPLAEETGAIHKLGAWVAREACWQAKKWQDRYPADPPLGINVNISVRQVLQPSLVEVVRGALSDSGLDPETLTLEITENDLLLETEEIVGRLRGLKELGVRLAIDDFGTGYSSLSYLGRFPVDVLKIDRSFMSRLASEKDPALTQAVVELGHTLSLEVVAEGIEDLSQLTALRALKCGRGQGFYFARPLEVAGVEELMDRGLLRSAAKTVGDA
ncbi:MAG: putative bifunctional diguanylate cyclase/phosphodiesterase [Actinomycetota bacterium]